MAERRTNRRVATYRDSKGQAATALNLFIGLCVVGVLAIFSYEISRILLVREQLKACVDIAALSGEATLLSSTYPSPAFPDANSARLAAENTAVNMFKRNSILGLEMTTVEKASTASDLEPSGKGIAKLFFEFVDPVNGNVNSGDTCNVLRVTGTYAYEVFGGQFMGLGTNTVYNVAVATKATLPALDLYVLMDLSASMDDQTPVTWVLRKWDPTANGGVGAPTYSIPPGPVSLGEGILITGGCISETGKPENGLEPQHLDSTQTPNWVPTAPGCIRCFSEILSLISPDDTLSLRGLTGDGDPPGDHPTPEGLGPGGLGTPLPEAPSGNDVAFVPKHGDDVDPLFPDHKANPTVRVAKAKKKRDKTPFEESALAAGPGPADYEDCLFTHLVVNIDGNNHFNNHNQFGYDFPTLGAVVEASVGNLETAARATGAELDLVALGNGTAIVPQEGYRDAYRIAAAGRVEPLVSVEKTVTNFFTKVRYSTDPHFGFIGFSDRAGDVPNDATEDFKVSWAYPQGGKSFIPCPAIHVNPTAGMNNYNWIRSILEVPPVMGSTASLLVADGGANTAEALQNAIRKLNPADGTHTTRDGAARAIILVTDGVPTYDLDHIGYSADDNGPAVDDAIDQAKLAKTIGIPVYVVGLCQGNPSLSSKMDDNYSDNAPNGVAYESGNGAKYYRVDWSNPGQTRSDLDAVFGNIARQLVNLVR